jgi:uncharacterized protein
MSAIHWFMFLSIGGGCLLMIMWKNAFRNHVNKHSFGLSHFPKERESLTIFFISDIHRRVIHSLMIKQAKEAEVVIIGGDLTERGVPLTRTRHNLRLLKKIGPVFFVWGNNDYEVGEQHLKQLLEEEGVMILDQDIYTYQSFTSTNIRLIGVNYFRTSRNQLEPLFQQLNPQDVNILISHHPRVIRQLKKADHIDLVLSGHTHGGQIRVFGLGYFEKGGVQTGPITTILTSNGYGTTGVPLRLGAPAEAHLIRLGK